MKKQLEDIICVTLDVLWNDVISKKRNELFVNARLIYFHIAITEIHPKIICERLNIHRTELYHYKKIFSDKMIQANFSEKYYEIEKQYYTF